MLVGAAGRDLPRQPVREDGHLPQQDQPFGRRQPGQRLDARHALEQDTHDVPADVLVRVGRHAAVGHPVVGRAEHGPVESRLTPRELQDAHAHVQERLAAAGDFGLGQDQAGDVLPHGSGQLVHVREVAVDRGGRRAQLTGDPAGTQVGEPMPPDNRHGGRHNVIAGEKVAPHDSVRFTGRGRPAAAGPSHE